MLGKGDDLIKSSSASITFVSLSDIYFHFQTFIFHINLGFIHHQLFTKFLILKMLSFLHDGDTKGIFLIQSL